MPSFGRYANRLFSENSSMHPLVDESREASDIDLDLLYSWYLSDACKWIDQAMQALQLN